MTLLSCWEAFKPSPCCLRFHSMISGPSPTLLRPALKRRTCECGCGNRLVRPNISESATHGVLDNRDPLNSYLSLTKTDDETEDDGLLYAREIIDLNLDADLAVLSACETGNGRISPGEGMIGMSWAFFVAGTRSVVVSQWRVNSAGTPRLMENFYQAMAKQNDLNSRNRSSALREASLRLMKHRRYRHPFYWAGFVLLSSKLSNSACAGTRQVRDGYWDFKSSREVRASNWRMASMRSLISEGSPATISETLQ
jgi:hypothetical protein